MRRIESIEDEMRGVVAYELGSGQRVAFSAKDVRLYGAAALLRDAGFDLDAERVPVYQTGHKIGTMAPDFDPLFVKSTSWLYEPRPSDFHREGDRWIADKMLGPGDLEAIPGFVWERGCSPVRATSEQRASVPDTFTATKRESASKNG